MDLPGSAAHGTQGALLLKTLCWGTAGGLPSHSDPPWRWQALKKPPEAAATSAPSLLCSELSGQQPTSTYAAAFSKLHPTLQTRCQPPCACEAFLPSSSFS